MTERTALQTTSCESVACTRGSRYRALAVSCVTAVAVAAVAAANIVYVVAALAMACAFVIAASSTVVRDAYARLVRRRARHRREAVRSRRIRRAGPIREQQYFELRGLVESCEPGDEVRFDLEGLLDRFTCVAMEHDRCVKAIERSDRNGPISQPRSDCRREIRSRRSRMRDDGVARVARLADDLDAIDELVRLMVARSASWGVGASVDRELDRRLAELDEIDAACDELAASS
jgi:hypothetical protein